MLRGPRVNELIALPDPEAVALEEGAFCEGTDPKWAETCTTVVVNIKAQSATQIGKENGMGVFRLVFVVVMGVLFEHSLFQISKTSSDSDEGI